MNFPIQKDGTVNERITIPQKRLRNDDNTLRAVAFNAAGGRGESTPLSVAFSCG